MIRFAVLLGFSIVAMPFVYMHYEIVMLKTFPPTISGACAMKAYHNNPSSPIPGYLKASLDEFWKSSYAPSCVLKEVKPPPPPPIPHDLEPVVSRIERFWSNTHNGLSKRLPSWSVIQSPLSGSAKFAVWIWNPTKNTVMDAWDYMLAPDDDVADDEAATGQGVSSTWVFEDGGDNDNSLQAYLDFAWNSASSKFNKFRSYVWSKICGSFLSKILDGFVIVVKYGLKVICKFLEYLIGFTMLVIELLFYAMVFIVLILKAMFFENAWLAALSTTALSLFIHSKMVEMREIEDRIPLVGAHLNDIKRWLANNNHYATLEVAEDATRRQLRQAYYEQACQYHPDNGGDGEQIKAINRAWELLGDDDERAQYNVELNSARQMHNQLDQELNSLCQKLKRSKVFRLLKQFRQ